MEKTLKIVVLGLSGKGKSATGNTILEKHIFESKITQEAVTHKCCIGKSSIVLEGELVEVQVVDTPGFFDGETKLGEIGLELLRGLEICPHPDAFLIVLEIGRITDLDILQFSTLTCIFGKEIFDHSIIVFTHGDKLKQSEYDDYLRSSKIDEYAEDCGHRVAIIENSNPIVGRNAEPVLRLIKDLIGKQMPFELLYKDARVSALKSLASTYDESQSAAKEVKKLYAMMLKTIKEEERQQAVEEMKRVLDEEREKAKEETKRVLDEAREKANKETKRVLDEAREKANEETKRALDVAREKANEETKRALDEAREKANEETKRALYEAREKAKEETKRALDEELRKAKEETKRVLDDERENAKKETKRVLDEEREKAKEKMKRVLEEKNQANSSFTYGDVSRRVMAELVIAGLSNVIGKHTGNK